MDVKKFLPVMENGIMPVFKAGFIVTIWVVQITQILILFPAIEHPLKVRKASLFLIAFFSFFISVTFFITIGTFGDKLTANLTFSFLNVARYINIPLIQMRIEILAVVIWILAGLTFTAIYNYFFSLTLAQFFKLKDYKIFVLPTALISVVWAPLIAKNNIEIGTTFTIIDAVVIIFGTSVPAIFLYVTELIRKKGTERI